ncbi:MAG: hypothetical protein AAFR41_03770 [Pseudomonadota bacterium]
MSLQTAAIGPTLESIMERSEKRLGHLVSLSSLGTAVFFLVCAVATGPVSIFAPY